MKNLISIIILLGCFPLFSQEQITFYKTEELPEETTNFQYISDLGENYLFRRGEQNYFIYTVDGQNIEYKSQLPFVNRSTTLCDDMLDCLYKNLFIDIDKQTIRIYDLTTNELNVEMNIGDLFVQGEVHEFNITDEKIYINSEAQNSLAAEVGIFNLLDNTFSHISNPDFKFIGRNNQHLFFQDIDASKIFIYNESTQSFDLLYSSSLAIVNIQFIKTPQGKALTFHSIENELVIIKSKEEITTYTCPMIDLDTIGDYMLAHNKLVYYELGMYSFDSNLSIYDFERCEKVAKKYVNSIYGKLSPSNVLGEDFLFYHSPQVDEGTLGAKGIVDINTDSIHKIHFAFTEELLPKHAILNDNKIYFLVNQQELDVGFQQWNTLVEVDLDTKLTKQYQLLEDGQWGGNFFPRACIPSGTSITEFNAFASSTINGFTQFYLESVNETIEKTYVGSPLNTEGGLKDIGQFISFDDNLFFTTENVLYRYNGSELKETMEYNYISDFARFSSNLTFGIGNQSDRTIFYYSKDASAPKLFDVHTYYLWTDNNNICENGYFKATFPNAPLEYFDPTKEQEVILNNGSILYGSVLGVSGANALIRDSDNHLIYNTVDETFTAIDAVSDLPSIFTDPIGQNDFLITALGINNGDPITKYYRLYSNGNKKKIAEFNFMSYLNHQVLTNSRNGYLLAVYDNEEVNLYSEKDETFLSFTFSSSTKPRLLNLDSKTLVITEQNNTEKLYLYDFKNDPFELESVIGNFISAFFIEGKTIFFFQNEDQIMVYHLTQNNELDLKHSAENKIDAIIESDRFVDIFNEKNIIIPLTTDLGKELYLYDIYENEFQILKDINPFGSSNPDHFTRDGEILFFTALVNENERQWHQLKVDPILKIENFTPDNEEILAPTLVQDVMFVNLDFDEFQIYTTTGQLLKSDSHYSALSPIEVSDYTSGLYFLIGKKEQKYNSFKFYKR